MSAAIALSTTSAAPKVNVMVSASELEKAFNRAPDAAWDEDVLTVYAKHHLTSSRANEVESIRLGRAAAVSRFYAGQALAYVKGILRRKHGQWTEWMRENDLKKATVEEAIRLYDAAQNVEAIKGLTIQQAEEKFGLRKPRRRVKPDHNVVKMPSKAVSSPTEKTSTVEAPSVEASVSDSTAANVEAQTSGSPVSAHSQLLADLKNVTIGGNISDEERDNLVREMTRVALWLDEVSSQLDWLKGHDEAIAQLRRIVETSSKIGAALDA